MILNYKYEIFPTHEQLEKLNRWINICRQTYNSALLDKSNRYKTSKKNLTRQEMQRIQTAKIKKHKHYNSITFTQFGVFQQKLKSGKLSLSRRAASLGKGGKFQISKLGFIDIAWHRKLGGKVKQVVIKRQVHVGMRFLHVSKDTYLTILLITITQRVLMLALKSLLFYLMALKLKNLDF
jgi:putative transposase